MVQYSLHITNQIGLQLSHSQMVQFSLHIVNGMGLQSSQDQVLDFTSIQSSSGSFLLWQESLPIDP